MSSDWVDAKIIAVSDCDSSHVAIDMRQGDEEYTISDLKKALKAFKYVQIAEQKLIDYISDLNNYDFSLTKMTKKTYINLIQLMKKEN